MFSSWLAMGRIFFIAIAALQLTGQAACYLEQQVLSPPRPPSSASSHVKFPSLIDATLDDLQTGLSSRLFTSADLVKTYIARINEVNDALSVVTEINPDAIDIAVSLDDERARGILKGPLHGIPILVKNNIATNDGMNNTSGSWLLHGAKVPRDATTVAKLRQAGAIILGKANLSQWAQSRSLKPVRGWSAHGGQTYAAYHEKQDPGGSSSGSGVASDLGLAFASLGTETDGSIIFPSHKNGIVGIKPTMGLTSRHLVIPCTEHQDTVGPMARTVRDAAAVLQAIAGYDPRDNYTSAIPHIPDYVSACKVDALRGARIGIPWNVITADVGMRDYLPREEFDAFRGILDTLTKAGAVLVPANFSKGREVPERTLRRIVNGADFTTNLASYLAELTRNPLNVTNLSDVRALTREHPLEDYPARDTGVFDIFLDLGFEGGNKNPRVWDAYLELLDLRGKHGMLGALDENDLDALVMPSGTSFSWAAVVGAPVVTVPMGHHGPDAPVRHDETGQLISYAPGVPLGLSFLGRRWSEEKLIGYAYAFEQRTLVRNKVVKRWISPKSEMF